VSCNNIQSFYSLLSLVSYYTFIAILKIFIFLTDISGGKRKAPPKAEKLVDHHLSIVRDAVAKHPGHPLVLMGKSMGSR
jgi:predicted alpha/beta-hydrolase family hydrolase